MGGGQLLWASDGKTMGLEETASLKGDGPATNAQSVCKAELRNAFLRRATYVPETAKHTYRVP